MCRSDIEFLGSDKDKLNPSKDNPNTYQLLSCWELIVSQIFLGNQLVKQENFTPHNQHGNVTKRSSSAIDNGKAMCCEAFQISTNFVKGWQNTK